MNKLIVFLFLGSALSAHANLCATAFQTSDFDGKYLEIKAGEKVKDLTDLTMDVDYWGDVKSWDNRISSIALEPGCGIKVYQYQNFGRDYDTGERIGARKGFKNKHHYKTKFIQFEYLDNKISSFKCVCH